MTPSPSPIPTTTSTSAAQKLDNISSDVAQVAGVAAAIAPIAGPYGLIASQVLQGIEFLANEAPDAYAAISAALQGAQTNAAEFAALRAQVAALSLDS